MSKTERVLTTEEIERKGLIEWLGTIKTFPKETVIDEDGRQKLADCALVELIPLFDEVLGKTALYATPAGLYLAPVVEVEAPGEQNKMMLDISITLEARPEHYVNYKDKVRTAIVKGQQKLSYKSS